MENASINKGVDTVAVGERAKINVGFFKTFKNNKFGQPLKEHFVHDGYGAFIKQPYEGTLMIHIKQDERTTVTREATEKDKVMFKEAYKNFLNSDSIKNEKEEELKKLREQVAAMEVEKKEKVVKEKKEKVVKEPKTEIKE
jgi:hypothetical protein